MSPNLPLSGACLAIAGAAARGGWEWFKTKTTADKTVVVAEIQARAVTDGHFLSENTELRTDLRDCTDECDKCKRKLNTACEFIRQQSFWVRDYMQGIIAINEARKANKPGWDIAFDLYAQRQAPDFPHDTADRSDS